MVWGASALLIAAGSGCGSGMPTGSRAASSLRIQARFAANRPSLSNLYCCDGATCDCIDSVRVSAYEVINGRGHLRASSARAIGSGDTTFALDLSIPSLDHYRIAVELTGYRILLDGPTLPGTQFYGLRPIEPSLGSSEPVVAVLEDAVPDPNATYTDITVVLRWSPVVGATGYTVLRSDGATWATIGTALDVGLDFDSFRVRAEFFDGVHGAYSGLFSAGAIGLETTPSNRTASALVRPRAGGRDSRAIKN